MKRLAAVLVVSTLLGAALLPAAAAWDFIPIQELCVVGQRADGTLIMKMISTDCVPEWAGSCLPQPCLH